MRIIDRTTHLSARNRERELEYHIANDTTRDFRVIYLPLHSRVQNLKVLDEDGRRLNVASKEMVDQTLANLRQSNPIAFEEFALKFKHAAEQVLVILPEDKPIAAAAWRTITFKFEEDSPESDFQIRGWRNQIQSRLFTVPRYSFRQAQYPGHVHSYQFVIVLPPDYLAEWSTASTENGEGRIKEYGKKGKTRAFTVRMAPAAAGRYDATIDYLLVPMRKATASVLVVFFALSTLAAIVALVARWWVVPNASIASMVQAVMGGLAATSLAMMTGFDDEWMERYKVALMLPLVLEVTNFLAWIA